MDLPKRKANRLPGYDYSQNGGYFVTICTQDKKNILWGKNTNEGLQQGKPVVLSNIGTLVERAINNISKRHKGIVIDKYVIMPNHIHMILILGDYETSPSLSRIVRQFKERTSKQTGYQIWQKSFYDRIIRDEDDYKS